LAADRVGAKPTSGKPGAAKFTEEEDKTYIARMQKREDASKKTIARLEAEVAASKAKATADKTEEKPAAAAPQKATKGKWEGAGKLPSGSRKINQSAFVAGATGFGTDDSEDLDRGYESDD
jgi:hypothetical protein